MSTSRLQLDFTLDTAKERSEFLNKYLTDNPVFQKRPLTPEEAEMCGNYLLWGKNENGKNMVQEKKVQISTRSGTWDQTMPESLDGLMEQPTFNEASLSPLLRGSAQIKIPREIFSRKKALTEAPDYLVPIFESLFEQIDNLDLLLNYYDLEHGKRKNPPREELLNKFTVEEQELIKSKASQLTSYQYLKKRHDLVELRREQYTYKDYYSAPLAQIMPAAVDPIDHSLTFDSEIPVFPLGLLGGGLLGQWIFYDNLDLSVFSEKQLQKISDFYWEHQNLYKNLDNIKQYIDFENEEHVYNLFNLFYDLEDTSYTESIEGNIKFLLKTFEYYINRADLTDIQREILSLKKNKKKNQDVADYINQKYGKSYSANYISTIFRQKAIKEITLAAGRHRMEISNLWFPENFKKCNTCGKLLLIDPENFVRKSRAKDGFANRCKICDRKYRQSIKGE